MGQFEQRYHRYPNVVVARFGDKRFEQLACISSRALRSDDCGRVEDQSQAGGSSGSRCAAIAASTSPAKSASIVAVDSDDNMAMHSEILRRGGAAGLSTAMA